MFSRSTVFVLDMLPLPCCSSSHCCKSKSGKKRWLTKSCCFGQGGLICFYDIKMSWCTSSVVELLLFSFYKVFGICYNMLMDPVMDWRPVQGVPRLSPEDCWDRLQPPRDPTEGLSGRKWMDGCGWMWFKEKCCFTLYTILQIPVTNQQPQSH